VLLVPLKFAADLKPGPLVLKADVSVARMQRAVHSRQCESRSHLEHWRRNQTLSRGGPYRNLARQIPQAQNSYPFRATWEQTATNDTRSLLFELPVFTHDKWLPITGADFFPTPATTMKSRPATEMISNPVH